jgi:hypothetical protein
LIDCGSDQEHDRGRDQEDHQEIDYHLNLNCHQPITTCIVDRRKRHEDDQYREICTCSGAVAGATIPKEHYNGTRDYSANWDEASENHGY